MKALLLLAALTLGGCVSGPRSVGSEDVNPAPSSSISLEHAIHIADAWHKLDPVNHWFEFSIAPSSSMVPILDSRSVVLLEKLKGKPRKHDIVIADQGPGRERVLHFIDDVRGDYVHMSGCNNRRADGWFPIACITWRVVAVIYTERR